MTLSNRLLFVIVLALLGGVLYQARLLASQGRERRLAADEVATARQQIRNWQQERGRAEGERAALEQEIHAAEADPKTDGAPASDTGLVAWLQRVDHLKECLRQDPARRIPEMRYLNSNDWLSVTFDNRLETDAQIRQALGKLRALAKAKPEISANLSNAVMAYARDHGGEPVTDVAQLRPYLQPMLGTDILARYAPVPEIPGENDRNGVNREGTKFRGSGRIVLQEQTPADADYDTRQLFMEQGSGSVGVSAIGKVVSQATAAFIKANPGQRLSQADQLLPYLTTPADAQAVREYWEMKDRK